MPFGQIHVALADTWGGDASVAHHAWASTILNQSEKVRTEEDIKRMSADCVIKVHDTPKESFWMDWHLTVPIFIERQFDKYRMSVQYQDLEIKCWMAPMGRDHITQNELSGRYRTIPDRPYLLPNDVRDILDRVDKDYIERKALKENRNLSLVNYWNGMLEGQHNAYAEMLEEMREAEKSGDISNAEYKRAREVLRGLLGTAYLTDMRILMNMNAFEHIICQRLAADAQVESRLVAYKMIKALSQRSEAKTAIDTMTTHHSWWRLCEDLETYCADHGEPISMDEATR